LLAATSGDSGLITVQILPFSSGLTQLLVSAR